MPHSIIDSLAVKHVVNFPEKPTLIFLHDSLGCIELWRDFPEQLAQACGCNYLVYDRQGYGKSCGFSNEKRGLDYLEHEADLLQLLLEKHQIKQAILFGHSDGGSIALLTAARHPQNIIGIITEGAHVLVEEVTLDGIREVMHQYQTTDLKSRLEKYHGKNTQALFDAWTLTWTSAMFRVWNIEYCLHEIKCPALIIQGEDDAFGTVDQVNRITAQIQKAQRLMLHKTGHNPHKEFPEKVIELTADFVLKMIKSAQE
ncbi:alpha/beta hydrolase [Flavobacterium sp. CYK-55]|uniref:alpha/beta fold hydrolase n=1 Tax=Flavobacterium sp. CYK-55 TaxID=2835529 RepID=UPI001BCE3A11|nr:alpha/beta hydrolase [Flavobacterium sp. CYK-55]MBS7788192.1 alpha/beta hydrolase [Flavobacterium sp. CYK-55]